MNKNLRLLLAAGLAIGIAFTIVIATIYAISNTTGNTSEIEIKHEIKFEGMELEGLHPTVVTGSIALDDPNFGLENGDCIFTVKPSNLDSKFSAALSDRIRQVEDLNSSDVLVDVSGGGWFFGEKAIEPAEAVEMIEEFDFKFHQDMLEKRIRDNKNVVFESRWYSCNMEFKDRLYDIMFILSVPVEINGTSGIISVFVTPDLLTENSSAITQDAKTVYDPFNNTIVWINNLDSWVTVKVNYTNVDEGGNGNKGQIRSDAKKIPPGGLLDMDLFPNWYEEYPDSSSKVGDRIYTYQIVEHSSIFDTIAVSTKYSHGDGDRCYSMKEAKPLYSQSKFDVRFPSYIPEGFAPVCYMTGSSSWFVQVYSSTSTKFGVFARNPDDNFMIGTQPKGIITIHSGEDPALRLNSTAYVRYQNMIANSVLPADAKFLVVNRMSVMAYVQGDVAAVDIFPNDEVYHHIQGKQVPIEELIKMAESLYEEGN